MSIPEKIDETELLIRNIFHPFGINSKGKLNINAFQPPWDSNEISVLRLFYTDINFCRNHGKTQEKEGKKLYGFAVIMALQILELGLNIVSTPYNDLVPPLPMHADILYKYTFKKGEPVPIEVKQQMKNLIEKVKYYNDPDPYSKDWIGDEIK